MSTVTSFIDGTEGQKHVATVGVTNKTFKTENTLDFSSLGATAADVVQCLNIPKGAYVTRVLTYVSTAEGAAATADLGDATDPNGYNDAVDLNATGAESSVAGTDAFAEGKLYTAADTIDLTLDDTLDTAVVTVVAEYFIVEAVANA